jgi:hypothetical protein
MKDGPNIARVVALLGDAARGTGRSRRQSLEVTEESP